MEKNLYIFSVVFVCVFAISLYSAHSSPVENVPEPEPQAESEKEGEIQPELKNNIYGCFAQMNYFRGRHSAPAFGFDSGLSASAYACARRYVAGTPVHSCPEARGFGEIVVTSGGGLTEEQLCPVGVNLWYAENRLYSYNYPNIYDWHRTGHFTLMVWRSSNAAGIACATGRTIRCVSLIRPQGNYPTVAAYKANIWPPRKEEGEEENPFLSFNPNLYPNVTID